ncbi:MAG TPA: TlpA disulfide reductase family protein [Myxococcales bacterium]
MSRLISLAALAAALAAAGCATAGSSSTSSSSSSSSGSPSPGAANAATEAADFTVKATDGSTFTLSEHLGKKVIVLDFWATWCVPCMAAMPHLEQLWQKYKDQDVLVVAVSMDGPETVAQVAPMARSHGLTFPVVLDEDTRAVSVYNPHRSAPYQVIIGRDGRIASSREGYNSGDEQVLEKTIQDLLAKAGAAAKPAEAVAPAAAPEARPAEAGAAPAK